MSREARKYTVLGGGSWGTALAITLAKNGHLVRLWVRDSSIAKEMSVSRRNHRYLSEFELCKTISIENELGKACQSAERVLMVIPSHSLREVFTAAIPHLPPSCTVISAIKGIEIESQLTMCQVMEQVMVNSARNDLQVGVLSGPSFAEEVAAEQPTAITVGFRDLAIAKDVQRDVGNSFLRVYASSDRIGLEISAAVKNVIAIAAGISDGLGFGLNARAALITRGLAEIERLGVAMGAEPATFAGLSGLGDLVLTCTGGLSRNRTVGLELGKGRALDEIIAEMKNVAEGVKTTRAVVSLARRIGVEMPILQQVYDILYGQKDARLAVKELLQREMKEE